MPDTEGTKKSGYRIEYAASARAKCKGPKPCAGTTLAKGELRFGSVVDFRGKTSFVWRHWGCVTPKVIENAKKSFENVKDLDGFEELKEDDQEKLKAAWEAGHVADDDIPPTANKSDGDGEEEIPKQRASEKKKEADNSKEDEKPRRSRGRRPKATEDDKKEPPEKPKASRARRSKNPALSAEVAEEEEVEVEEKPKKKAAPRKKPESKAKQEPGVDLTTLRPGKLMTDATELRMIPVQTRPESKVKVTGTVASDDSYEFLSGPDGSFSDDSLGEDYQFTNTDEPPL